MGSSKYKMVTVQGEHSSELSREEEEELQRLKVQFEKLHVIYRKDLFKDYVVVISKEQFVISLLIVGNL